MVSNNLAAAGQALSVHLGLMQRLPLGRECNLLSVLLNLVIVGQIAILGGADHTVLVSYHSTQANLNGLNGLALVITIVHRSEPFTSADQDMIPPA